MKETFIRIVRAFSPFEYLLFLVLVALLAVSALALAGRASDLIMAEAPEDGGSLTEGIIGSPRFVNPLLAVSEADRDLAALVYSGLLLRKPSGELVPNLAENYAISDDGLSYTFVLRDNAFFHDGERVTADDVIFTAHKAQDPALKSPKRASWDSISVEKVDERTVRFTLKQPYAPFLDNMTLGILPEHIWHDADAEQFQFSIFNIEPIGSGPYTVESIKRNASGVPTLYTLKAYRHYALGRPHLDSVTTRFYSNETELRRAVEKGDVESASGISPASLANLSLKGAHVEMAPLPRIFAVFFNQNQATLFTNKEVRVALDTALPKERIVEEVLAGYGTPIEGPIPPGTLQALPPQTADTEEIAIIEEEDTTIASSSKEASKEEVGESTLPPFIEEARDILTRNGWEYDEEKGHFVKKKKKETIDLAFSLATSNAPELKHAAELVVDYWKLLGADVTLQVFETGDLNQNVIRPRKYDALLFGEVVGRELDLFAFWHSSQRNDPGLNIALYANIATDKYLEDARTLSDRVLREEKYRLFEAEVEHDAPAVFLYSPEFIYIVPDKIRGLSLGPVTTPEERFLNVHEWYIETNRVWKLFNQL